MLREKNREADRLANLAMDRGVARKTPVVSPGSMASAAAAVPEFSGIVKNGVVQFMGAPLPEGTLVKVRAVKP